MYNIYQFFNSMHSEDYRASQISVIPLGSFLPVPHRGQFPQPLVVSTHLWSRALTSQQAARAAGRLCFCQYFSLAGAAIVRHVALPLFGPRFGHPSPICASWPLLTSKFPGKLEALAMFGGHNGCHWLPCHVWQPCPTLPNHQTALKIWMLGLCAPCHTGEPNAALKLWRVKKRFESSDNISLILVSFCRRPATKHVALEKVLYTNTSKYE